MNHDEGDHSMSTIQHVNFWWLKDPSSEADRARLANAAEALKQIPGVQKVSFGPRAATDWEGPDTTFDLGMIITFESLEALRAYMPHPLHLEAIAVSEAVMERYHAFYFEG
jgi:hypothetical protein